jgi:hypothetical protein
MELWKRSLQTALIVAGVAAPIRAAAQDRIGLTLGAGVLSVTDPYPAADLSTPAYAFGVQRVIKRYFVVDTELTHAAYTLTHERGPGDVFGPEGRIGSVQRTTTIDAHSVWNLSANLLVRTPGRVRVFGGAGLGVSMDNNLYTQESFGCAPVTLTCSRYSNDYHRGPIPFARLVGGVEVPLTSRIGVFGSVRAETSNWEERSNWMVAIAGVRFAFQ